MSHIKTIFMAALLLTIFVTPALIAANAEIKFPARFVKSADIVMHDDDDDDLEDYYDELEDAREDYEDYLEDLEDSYDDD